MKNFKLKVLILLLALSFTNSVFGTEAQPNESEYNEKSETIYPFPEGDDVLVQFGLPTSFGLNRHKVKMLVWNLYKGSLPTFRVDYAKLSLGKDIIVAQEMYLDQNMEELFKIFFNYKYIGATSFYSGKEKIRTGVLSASPVKPSRVDYIRTEATEPIVGTPKVTLITEYPILLSKKKLTVVNIHSINFVTTKTFKAELQRIVDVLKEIDGPLVFAGDFNTWNADRLKILKEYTTQLNLTEATFEPDRRMRFNGYPLDHVLVSKDITIIKTQAAGKVKGSDHTPIEIEFSINLKNER